MFSSKQLVRLVAPLFGEQFLVVLVGITDTFMVAHAGESAVSGVALVDTISYLVVAVFGALCAGGSILASQYSGSGDRARVSLAARLVMGSTLAIALAMAALVLLCGNGLLALIFGRVEPEVMRSAREYFALIGCSFPFLAAYSAAAALFRSQGNSMVTLAASLLMNGLNVAGNAWFIYGKGMGAAGAALATLIARGGAAVLLCVLLAKSGMLAAPQKQPVRLAECREMLGKILYVGIPSGVESGLFSLGKLLVQRLYAGLGTVALAANAAAGALSCIATLPGGALSLAMLPVVGRAVGAGQPEEAKRLAAKLLRAAYGLMLAANLLVYVFLPQLSGLYALSAETTAVVRELLAWHCLFATLFYPAGFCTPSALRAAGDVRFTMAVSIASMLVCRVGLSCLFVLGLGWGVVSIWMTIFCDWGVRAVLFSLRLRSGAWQKHKIV